MEKSNQILSHIQRRIILKAWAAPVLMSVTLPSHAETSEIAITTNPPTAELCPATVAPFNSFEFVAGTNLTVAGLEARLGITLENPVVSGDTITFTNVGYTIPDEAFNFPDIPLSLVNVVTTATEVGEQGFFGQSSMQTVEGKLMTFLGPLAFEGCSSVSIWNFPCLTDIPDSTWISCTASTTFNLPSLTGFGQDDPDNDQIFFNIIGNNITITLPSQLQGSQDEDILYLDANNNVTFIYV